jgi:acyl-CoA thioester hydrolase
MPDSVPQRADYLHFQPIITRWHDNDVYGHVNNVTYGGEHLFDRTGWFGYS